MKSGIKPEWSRYYQVRGIGAVDALHARFVTHRYARHAHDHFVVGVIEAGVQSYWYRGARQITAAGQVFLVNAGEPHTGEPAAPAGYTYRTFYPRPEELAALAEDVGQRRSRLCFAGAVLDDPLLGRLLSHCGEAISTNAVRVESESLFVRAMARLITTHADPKVSLRPAGRERPAVTRAREYMEANFAGDISLSELSALSLLSPFYFARTFEREVGLPPHAYLEGVRIRKARELLDCGETLAAAALSVGYSDQSHFTHRFKRQLGITPGQYVRARVR
jgi:AraC-like DNA-binding protein